jgi:hypothetical protein
MHRALLLPLLLTSTLVFTGAPGGAAEGEPARADQPAGAVSQGPLKGLPSMPGAHIDKIKALPDNSWLELGMPAADPQWGRAPGPTLHRPPIFFAAG